MKKIVAFGASSSRQSINKKLAEFAAHQIPDAEVNLLDLNDYEMPIYSIDREIASGIHPLAMDFRAHLAEADGIIISFAEHNGAYSAAFKNVFDWISRGGPDIWGNNPMLLMATSPGGRGGIGVLEIATNKLKRMNTSEVLSFSLPSFGENFEEGKGITNAALQEEFQGVLQQFIENLNQ